ncbi:hypothetical protein CAL7716_100410 (plasmid) [Calothrix sp. PCC 7716]|nr:hypothetical protein CAL7716_100410 [Calothrix sp. PCC 7716]
MKIGFAKFNKVSRDILSENFKLNLVTNHAAVSEQVDLDWVEYKEKLENEKKHGIFVSNKELAEINEQDKREREELQYQYEKWLEVDIVSFLIFQM